MRLQIFCVVMIGAMAVVSAQTPSKQAKQAPDPHSLVLVGDRFKPLKYDEMTPEQKTMIDHLLAGERGGVRGPFNVLLRSPEVGDLGAEFGGAMRFRTGLPANVREVIIIMTGRFWMAQYEWNSHKAAALQNGVSPAIVDAIATGKRPAGMPPEMESGLQPHRRTPDHSPGDRCHVQGRQGQIWRARRRRHDRVERMVRIGFDVAQRGPVSVARRCAARPEASRESAPGSGNGICHAGSGSRSRRPR